MNYKIDSSQEDSNPCCWGLYPTQRPMRHEKNEGLGKNKISNHAKNNKFYVVHH